MTKEQYDVVVDVHEPPKVVEEFENHNRVSGTSDVPLPAGDVGLGGDGDSPILCERKEVSDFASSVTGSKRNIFEQVEKMQNQVNTPPYVLIEGDMSDFTSLWHTDVAPQALRGAVSSLSVRKGAHVLFCSDLDSLVDVAVSLADKHSTAPSSSHLHSGSVDVRESVTRRMYGQIGGVGSSAAKALEEEFSSVEQLLQASEDELRSVGGIGEKRAESIRAALR